MIIGVNDDQSNPSALESYSLKILNMNSPSQAVSGLTYSVFLTTQANQQKIIALTGENRAKTMSFVSESEKIDMYWQSAQVVATQPTVDAWEMLFQSYNSTQIFTSYLGYYNCDMQLIPKDGSNFQTTFGYTLGSSIFAIDTLTGGNPILASTGNAVSTFKLAALPTSSPGIYQLSPSKVSGDTQLLYMNLPPVAIVVSTNKCVLSSKYGLIYTVSLGGASTLPILLDFSECLPTHDIMFTPVFSVANQIAVDS